MRAMCSYGFVLFFVGIRLRKLGFDLNLGLFILLHEDLAFQG
jgi:hypothetical protein